MDNIAYTNPLETVQFISICSYLYALSDFLFIENYLSEVDQNKQILVVNALYDYLEDYHNNQTMKLKLIRYLLKGSDLYGEEENENIDVIFVNTMFNYIIKSLVFDKYTNIYGFLADVFRKVKNLQLDLFLREIIIMLRNAKFENEYAKYSKLSSLAVNRIFTDIISPLFPQPKTNLTLLSLDYIYAQAGSNFLQPGRINTAYYTDFNFNSTILNQETLFDEYLITGLIIHNNIFNENISFGCLQAFALPALFLHLSRESVENEKIKNINFDSDYWKAAYENLFSHIDSLFNEIKSKLIIDTNYQLHKFLSRFYKDLSRNIHCKHSSLEETESIISKNLNMSANFSCIQEFSFTTLSDWFMNYINKISDIFEKHDLKSIQQSFEEPLLKYLKYDKIDIDLLAPADYIVHGIFDNSTRLSYDLFEFYNPENATSDYFALMREKYTTKLIKLVNGKDFEKVINVNIQTLLNHRFHRIHLKSANQTMDLFWQQLIAYKKLRIESYLKFSGTDRTLNKWWNEFGLTLVPFYQCKIEITSENINKENSCEINEFKFLNNFKKDISSFIIQENTKLFLSSLGTSIRTIFMKNVVDENSKFTEKSIEYILQLLETKNICKLFFEKLSLHIDEPEFQINFITNKYLLFFHTIIYRLQSKTNFSFTSFTNILNNLYILKSNVLRQINVFDKKTNRYLYTNTYNSTLDTGYGYKFIYLNKNEIAFLRTDYEDKTKNFVHLIHSELDGEKMYSIVNNDTFVKKKHYIFEINNQLQKNVKKCVSFGLSMHSFNKEKCDIEIYLQISIPLTDCPRHARRMKKWWNLQEVIKLALEKQVNLTKEQIMETMKMFIFPDEDRIDLQFMETWINDKDLKIPEWAEHYRIENPQLLLKLRYDLQLDDSYISNYNGTIRIKLHYTFQERKKIEEKQSLISILTDFHDQNAYYLTTFEDYYAIRNFVTNGYRKITGNTYMASFMKIALYKLAIRQSDDPDDEFDLTLYSIEAKPIDIINSTLISRKIYNLQKFSMSYTNLMYSINLATVPLSGYKNILYEMKFSQSYFRAKISQFYKFNETISILLPGTEFSIVNITEIQLFNLGDCLKVELMYNHKNNDKYEWYKKIMKEITRITNVINE
ncbi:uncharacterized protein LOC127280336 isoform X3 [Leptopilina boulardi]|uniref:uncharacterized protein LOC127280336 isoform X3 n=1 Tax=Leptopilina boulardi TaxID=63433 RepID=UPI0021F5ADF2|nr:uncharacterized protein LOC127280336 isoform X3 [Leptopilina boulardi]